MADAWSAEQATLRYANEALTWQQRAAVLALEGAVQRGRIQALEDGLQRLWQETPLAAGPDGVDHCRFCGAAERDDGEARYVAHTADCAWAEAGRLLVQADTDG